MPMFKSATCSVITWSPILIGPPHGTTAPVINEVNKAIHGPIINNHLFDKAGINSSFMIIFTPSAKGCKSPKGPALFGPILSCMIAETLRSANVAYKATSNVTTKSAITMITFISRGSINYMKRKLCLFMKIIGIQCAST